MALIIGLGNPDQKYKNTRHNFGFLVVDEFAKKNNFPEFKLSKKYNSLISESVFEGEKTLLVKLRTFMNESGNAVKKIVSSLRFKVQSLVVVHDDIDLPLGQIRIVKNRGSAGHKGIESVIKELGTEDFVRIRIGILPEAGKPQEPEKFVLKNFTEEEKLLKEAAIKKVVSCLDCLVKNGLEKAMNEYNR